MPEVEQEMDDFLNKKKELETDKYKCPHCGTIIKVAKGEYPERCYPEQGGCNKKSKKFEKVEIIKEGEKNKKEKKKTKEEEKIERIKKVREKEKKIEKEWMHRKHKDLNSDVYIEMDAFVDMVAEGISYGTIIEGRGGTGKTWRVINRLHDVEYAYTDSFTTPQAFYIWLYRNRDKEVLVVDDVAGFMNNNKVLAFLKGALWEVNGERILHYMTTKPMQDEYGNFVPNAFRLSARMIIITNKLNKKNPHLNAVVTRVNYCKVEIDHAELMNILKQVAKKDFPDLSYEDRMEVYEFINKNTSNANNDLNIRSLIKCFQHKRYSKRINNPDLWKRLAMLNIINKNPILVTVEELISNPKFGTEGERVAEFENRTGRSRATYFRMKEQLKHAGDSLKEKQKN